jgi:hypothetical protein
MTKAAAARGACQLLCGADAVLGDEGFWAGQIGRDSGSGG